MSAERWADRARELFALDGWPPSPGEVEALASFGDAARIREVYLAGARADQRPWRSSAAWLELEDDSAIALGAEALGLTGLALHRGELLTSLITHSLGLALDRDRGVTAAEVPSALVLAVAAAMPEPDRLAAQRAFIAHPRRRSLQHFSPLYRGPMQPLRAAYLEHLRTLRAGGFSGASEAESVVGWCQLAEREGLFSERLGDANSSHAAVRGVRFPRLASEARPVARAFMVQELRDENTPSTAGVTHSPVEPAPALEDAPLLVLGDGLLDTLRDAALGRRDLDAGRAPLMLSGAPEPAPEIPDAQRAALLEACEYLLYRGSGEAPSPRHVEALRAYAWAARDTHPLLSEVDEEALQSAASERWLDSWTTLLHRYALLRLRAGLSALAAELRDRNGRALTLSRSRLFLCALRDWLREAGELALAPPTPRPKRGAGAFALDLLGEPSHRLLLAICVGRHPRPIRQLIWALGAWKSGARFLYRRWVPPAGLLPEKARAWSVVRLCWALDPSPDKRDLRSEEAQTSLDAQWFWCVTELDEALDERREGRPRAAWRARFAPAVWALKAPWPGNRSYRGDRRELGWIREQLGAKALP